MMDSHLEFDWNENWLAFRVVGILHRHPNIKFVVENPCFNEIYGQLIVRESNKLLYTEILNTLVPSG